MKTSEELRQAYLDFWQKSPRNSKVVPNASLVPNNDPTLLFVNSGMFPLVPYLGGEPHPLGTRLVNVQRCVRTIDIDEVGDYNHLVLFEMIGNWSLGDYTKADQIPWKMELYVEHFGLNPSRIYASVWAGDNDIPRDDEAIEAWVKAFANYGIEAEFSEDITNVPQKGEPSTKEWKYRIFPYGKSDNWWQRGPDTPGELGGPSSEIFYDMGSELTDTGELIHINDDSGRYMEVGNSVFMEYKYSEQGEWVLMEQKNVDFGGGLDRIVATVQGKRSIYETDLFEDVINKIEEISGQKYESENPEKSELTKSIRIIAEHARSCTFIIADGVMPGNKDQSYILRRLIRRMVRHGLKIGIESDFTTILSHVVIEKMEEAYPHLAENKDQIIEAFSTEEQKFRRTIEKGVRELRKMIDIKTELDGEKAFYIYETFGFPLELTIEEFDLNEDEAGLVIEQFNEAQQKHQEQSRAGAEKKFAGGLADQSDDVIKLHTTHHLLLKALQIVLGDHVKQRGSNITGERLRIDFDHAQALTPEEIENVEKIVNEKIQEKLDVIRVEMPREEAEQIGAEMEFGQKYPDIVSVYFVAEKTPYIGKGGSTSGKDGRGIPSDFFSAEFCGGPHINNTSELSDRVFKIKKQESIGSGKRRIKAVLG